ncbi:hypothetical protein LL254_00630 [Marinobacter nauticus]|uniref:hypothetical protein n=1 Tax=Marinobacter nauticus TaxID=2743 RepID=UPI001D18F9A5|nr:hypothetical protein [Marinobacter nauticus]MCC4269212.1 hypothetical protein [Marinobacter nauticus]
MRQWAIYDPQGKISRVYSGPESEALLQPGIGEQVALLSDGLDDTAAYVLGGQAVPRQPFDLHIDKPQIVADGNDTATISSVPAGTTIIWHDGQEDVVNDGQVQLSTDLPGTYTLTFDAVPFLRQEVTIEAVTAT